MSDASRWRQLREIFDAVCELSADQWPAAVGALTRDAGLAAEVLELLGAQTLVLQRLQAPLESLAQTLEQPEVGVGDHLGPWLLTSLLARGGMGAVFLADRDDHLYRRKVAVKVIRSVISPGLGARLAAEQQILADLQHPGVARLYDAGLTPTGNPYLVMEYVEGQPLDVFARALDLEQRLRLFVRICRIVQFAHARLIVHCDLKPGNVLVLADGNPVLLDFGVARILEAQDESGEQTAPTFLTPAYSSPEMLAGKRVGVASDVFSLGVILTELLADQRLTRGLDQANTPVPKASQLAGARCRWRRKLPGGLDAIAVKASAITLEARYGTVETLADDVERYLACKPLRAVPGSLPLHARLFVRRRWRETLVSLLVLALIAVFVVRLNLAGQRAQASAAAATQTSDFLIAAFSPIDPALRGGDATRDPGARELLDLSALRLQDARMPVEVRARLEVALGRAYMNLGRPRQARDLLQKGATTLASAPVAQDREAATAFADLSVQLAQLRDAPGAEAAARQADVLLARSGAGSALIQAQVLNAHGLVSRLEGRDQVAQDSFAQALKRLEQDAEPGARQFAQTVTRNLATAYRSAGQLDRAEAVLRRGMAQEDGWPSARSIEYQKDMQLLSEVLFDRGRIEQALEVMERNLDLTRQIYGANSSYTASAESALAGQYLDLGRYDSADRHFRSSLQVSAVVDGTDSYAYADKVFAHGVLKDAYGDAASAERLYRQALASQRRLLGIDSPVAMDIEMSLARLLLREGHLQESQAMLQRIGASWRLSRPAGSPDLQALRLVEIEWMSRAGKFTEARDALDEFHRRHPQPASWLALREKMQLALLAQRSGQPQAADAWALVVAEFSRLYGADSVATAKWRIPYAEALTDADRVSEAKAQVQRARAKLREVYPGSEFVVRMTTLEQRWAKREASR